ncbi:Os05g0240850 [Oryza sativa Japonica Group]|uniref:Os05g0240850 protein n=2 Tax=Oryza TaxID=4527 RepID=Q60EV2_ORYSJ|nr:unknown protein [Oryza sativa Japonica Group]BAH93019.1 Os05g0240850 [Oryza sativa Japonica Group]|eukprot:NP_001174291.1 Os05g0240850 [Oryza sativa Japonica Group]
MFMPSCFWILFCSVNFVEVINMLYCHLPSTPIIEILLCLWGIIQMQLKNNICYYVQLRTDCGLEPKPLI